MQLSCLIFCISCGMYFFTLPKVCINGGLLPPGPRLGAWPVDGAGVYIEMCDGCSLVLEPGFHACVGVRAVDLRHFPLPATVCLDGRDLAAEADKAAAHVLLVYSSVDSFKKSGSLGHVTFCGEPIEGCVHTSSMPRRHRVHTSSMPHRVHTSSMPRRYSKRSRVQRPSCKEGPPVVHQGARLLQQSLTPAWLGEWTPPRHARRHTTPVCHS